MSILKAVCVLVRNLFVNRSILIAENLALRQQLAVQQRTVRRRSRGGNSEGARPAFDPGQWSSYLRQHGIGSQHELFQPETFIRSLPAENYVEKALVKSADEVLDLWIGTRMKAIKEQSPNHFVTVGHNKPMTLLPANQQLDFIAHHKYHKAPLADSYEGLLGNVMIYDMLREVFPNKPITIGEFSYSSGRLMTNGEYLDPWTASVAEMAHMIYSFANEYSGLFSWLVTVDIGLRTSSFHLTRLPMSCSSGRTEK